MRLVRFHILLITKSEINKRESSAAAVVVRQRANAKAINAAVAGFAPRIYHHSKSLEIYTHFSH